MNSGVEPDDKTPLWKTAFTFTLMCCGSAWLHAWASYRYGSNEPGLIFWSMLLVATPGKIGFLCCFPYILRRVFLVVNRNFTRCAVVGLSWAVTAALGITLLVLARDRLAEMLNYAAIRIYPVSNDSPALAADFIGREDWLPRWQSGQILAIEAGYVVVLIATLLGLGLFWPNRDVAHVGGAKLTTAVLAVIGVTIAWPFLFGLFVLDYDFFLGGLFSDALALDLLWPIMTNDVLAQIAAPVYLAFTLSTWLGLRIALYVSRRPVR